MIAIVGAGISGLLVAHFLQKKKKKCIVFEKASLPGGVLHTLVENPYIFETAAHSILISKENESLFQDLNISHRVRFPNTISKKRYILKNNVYHPITSPISLFFSSFLSVKAKLNIFLELLRPIKYFNDESVGDFFERRFSKEIVDRLVSPLLFAIYACDPYEVLLESVFPVLKKYESQYGSVIKGVIKERKNISSKKSMSFEYGLSEWVDGLAKNTSIRYNCAVDGLETKNGMHFLYHGKTFLGNFEQLVIATPAYQSATLLSSSFPQWAVLLDAIEYVPMAVLHLVFPKEKIKIPLDGFGGLHPICEKKYTMGVLWSSSVFSNRCPQDEVLLTVFIGGRQRKQEITTSPEGIEKKAIEEIQFLYKISHPPIKKKMIIWKKALPQYGKKQLKASHIIHGLASHKIYLHGNWIDGISLNHIINRSRKQVEFL